MEPEPRALCCAMSSHSTVRRVKNCKQSRDPQRDIWGSTCSRNECATEQIIQGSASGNTFYLPLTSQKTRRTNLVLPHSPAEVSLHQKGKPFLGHDRTHICLCCCSFAKLCLTLCDPLYCSPPSFPVLEMVLPELAQTNVHWVSDAIQPSHPLLPPFSPALNLSQPQGLFQWVCPQSFPASGSFPMSPLFASGGPKHWSFSFSISPSKEYWVDFLRISLMISLWLSVISWHGPVLISHHAHSEHPLTSSKLSYIFNIFPTFSLPPYFPLTLGALKDLISHLQAGAVFSLFFWWWSDVSITDHERKWNRVYHS